MENVFLYPYDSASVASKLMANELGIKRLKREGSLIKDTPKLIIINWGASRVPFQRARIINLPPSVASAANKLRFFQRMAGDKQVHIPAFTTDYGQASAWIREGSKVCSRAVLNGNSGEGLVVTGDIAKLPRNSPLYTKYRPKSAEYRVHVVEGHVIRVQRKVWPREKAQPPDINWEIRNHENGFIFQVAAFGEIPAQVLAQARLCMKVAELNFGGVDVIWDQKNKWAGILEVNTAPGIEGETVTIYSNSFKDMLRG